MAITVVYIMLIHILERVRESSKVRRVGRSRLNLTHSFRWHQWCARCYVGYSNSVEALWMVWMIHVIKLTRRFWREPSYVCVFLCGWVWVCEWVFVCLWLSVFVSVCVRVSVFLLVSVRRSECVSVFSVLVCVYICYVLKYVPFLCLFVGLLVKPLFLCGLWECVCMNE